MHRFQSICAAIFAVCCACSAANGMVARNTSPIKVVELAFVQEQGFSPALREELIDPLFELGNWTDRVFHPFFRVLSFNQLKTSLKPYSQVLRFSFVEEGLKKTCLAHLEEKTHGSRTYKVTVGVCNQTWFEFLRWKDSFEQIVE